MNPDGSNLQELTSYGFGGLNPTWSPDGTKILFRSYRDNKADIFMMNADGSMQTKITSEIEGHKSELPDWRP
jgi:TolB protein